MSVLIRNGRLIDPASGRDSIGDVYVANGKIQAMDANCANLQAGKVIEASGLAVIPGIVDLSARLREPGLEYKATLESEMAAALAGGVTSIVCPPDTDPVLDEPGLVEMLKHRAANLHQSRLFPLGALTLGLKGEIITEMAELTEAGCVGFSHANVPVQDTQALLRAMQYAHSFGYTVWLQPSDAFLGRGGVAHSGPVASRMGLSGVPVAAETIALHTIFELVRASQCRVHLCRLSSAAGVELVRQAKADGLPVTADVAIHHVHLTDVDIGYFDANCRVDPPFRSQRDRDAIHRALLDGTLDAICSDHTPVDDDSKILPFGEAESGVTGLEILLPLTLSWARREKVPLVAALAKITSASAALLHKTAGSSQAMLDVPPLGSLTVGAAADLVLVDLDAPWVLEKQHMRSQGRNTPFIGRELIGKVKHTIIDGRLVTA
jgi:dihydroorotase